MYPGHWAKTTPEKPAVINSETAEHVTYHELDQYSNQLAQLLLARGLRRGDHIAVFMENQVAYFVVGWAAMRSGLYVTPINRYLTTEETAYILNDCGAKAIITSRGIAASDDLGNEVPNCSIRTFRRRRTYFLRGL